MAEADSEGMPLNADSGERAGAGEREGAGERAGAGGRAGAGERERGGDRAGVGQWTDLEPVLHPEPYVYVTVPAPPPGLDAFAMIREDEGVTLVLTRRQADGAGLPYGYVAARITLTIDSALAAIGLTAAVSRMLADAGISCNVIAGFAHDHLFVDWDRGEEAAALLRGL